MTAPSGTAPAQDLVETFCRSLGRVGGRAQCYASRSEACTALDEIVAGRAVVVDAHPDLDGVEVAGAERVEDPWAADVGVTGVLAAVAETGTLALVAGPRTPRRTSLVPPTHVALVPVSRLLATYAEAVAMLAALDPTPSNMQFITGPSRSSDIEMRPVQGMHGPKEVVVLLYTDHGAAGSAAADQ